MCGIVFALSKPHHHAKLDNFINDALLASQVRGVDSTGLFRVSHTPISSKGSERTITSKKAAVDASMFLRSAVSKDMVKSSTYAALTVGHVRHKTQGAVRDSNAHPFEVMRTDQTQIIGVHNGTLNGWKDMVEGDDYDVDSEWMYNMIAEDGIDAFKGFDGAYALVWYDSEQPDVVNIARNEKRTLFFARTEDRKGIIGASELGLLAWVAARNEIKLWSMPNEKEGGEPHRIFYFEPGILYRFSLNTMEILSTTKLPTFDAANNPYKSTKPKPVTSTMMGNPSRPYYPINDPYQHKFNQTHVLTTVQKIMTDIRESRKEPPFDTEDVVTSDELVDGADVAATTNGSLAITGVEVGKSLIFAEGMSASSATTKEISLAKALGYFGLVGYARSYYHEEEISELRCSFSLKAPKPGQPINFDDDAVIKFVKTDMHEVGGVYSDKAMEGMKFAVVGVSVTKSYDPKKADYPTLVLVPVTKQTRLVTRRVTPVPKGEVASATLH